MALKCLRYYTRKNLFENDQTWPCSFYLLRSIWNFSDICILLAITATLAKCKSCACAQDDRLRFHRNPSRETWAALGFDLDGRPLADYLRTATRLLKN